MPRRTRMTSTASFGGCASPPPVTPWLTGVIRTKSWRSGPLHRGDVLTAGARSPGARATPDARAVDRAGAPAPPQDESAKFGQDSQSEAMIAATVRKASAESPATVRYRDVL